MVISGIYQILNSVNAKCYIGSAKDIHRRWHEHRKYLRRGTHKNAPLQNAWNKYGEFSFEFKILEPASFEDLIIKEQWWLNHFSSLGDVYNINLEVSGFHGRSHTEETKSKISQTKKAQGLHTVHSDETRAKISAILTGRKYGPLNEKHRRKIGLASDHHPISESNKQKLIQANGRHFSLISPNGVVITGFNLSAFCREYGFKTGAMSNVLNGVRSHHKGWKKYEQNHSV